MTSLAARRRPIMALWFPVVSSARRTSSGGSRGERRRALARFFSEPQGISQRRYEALRAYFVEGLSAADAAKRFGYAASTMVAMVRDFRPEAGEFFIERRPGPRVAPAKQAARERVLALRAQGRSVTEIAAALADSPTPLNRTGVWELLREEGIERLAPRPASERGVPLRDHPPRVRVLRWPERPFRERSSHVGLMLLLPGLVALDLPGAAARARLPGTREVPAICSLLALLALKAAGRRRVSHVDDVCTDIGLATFAGLETLPKASSLGSYSWRLERSHSEALQAALQSAMLASDQAHGSDFDLDFHAIMHFGEDVALETHYVPRRSQRTESVLTFFAHDGETHNLVYSNAACTKADQAGEVLAFVRHWQAATGQAPELLVFDSKVTTGAGLAELHAAGLRFLTLRARKPKLTAELEALPDSEWTTVTLDRKGRYARPQVHEHEVTVRGCPVPLRQIAVRGLGHEHPTLILTNDRDRKPARLIDRYAARMSIEQRLAEAIRSFHLDSLSSAVALNVDFDCTLTIWAAAAYDHLRRQLTGYHTATPDTIWRRFLSTPGHITIGPDEVIAELDSRTYSPVMRTARLPTVKIPWWEGRRLRFQFR
jgi:transposase